jgi:hypothetical protein
MSLLIPGITECAWKKTNPRADMNAPMKATPMLPASYYEHVGAQPGSKRS